MFRLFQFPLQDCLLFWSYDFVSCSLSGIKNENRNKRLCSSSTGRWKNRSDVQWKASFGQTTRWRRSGSCNSWDTQNTVDNIPGKLSRVSYRSSLLFHAEKGNAGVAFQRTLGLAAPESRALTHPMLTERNVNITVLRHRPHNDLTWRSKSRHFSFVVSRMVGSGLLLCSHHYIERHQ